MVHVPGRCGVRDPRSALTAESLWAGGAAWRYALAVPSGVSQVLKRSLSASAERAALFLVEAGHDPDQAVAMACGLVKHRIPSDLRRWRTLRVTPHERESLAHTLQARRVLVEGMLLGLDRPDVRDGAILSAHALCEARQARRPVQLSIGGGKASLSQVQAARTRLQREIHELDELVEAAVESSDHLSRDDKTADPNPRVVHLQNRLNSLGFRVQPDGMFGEVTEESVKDMQAKAGLDPSGVVDAATRDALRHGGRPSWDVQAPPGLIPGQPVPPGAPPAADYQDVNKETQNDASQATPKESQPAEKSSDGGKTTAKSEGKSVSVNVKLKEALTARLQEAQDARARAVEQGDGMAIRVAEARAKVFQAHLGELQETIGPIKKGAFHAWLGKPLEEPITDADIARGIAAGGHPAKMARFAKAARGFNHHRRTEEATSAEDADVHEADSKADYPSTCMVCGARVGEKGVCQRGHSQHKLMEATVVQLASDGVLDLQEGLLALSEDWAKFDALRRHGSSLGEKVKGLGQAPGLGTYFGQAEPSKPPDDAVVRHLSERRGDTAEGISKHTGVSVGHLKDMVKRGLLAHKKRQTGEGWGYELVANPEMHLAEDWAAFDRLRGEGGLSRHFPAGHPQWHDDLMSKGLGSDELDRGVQSGELKRTTTPDGLRYYHLASDQVAAGRMRRLVHLQRLDTKLSESAKTPALSTTHAPIGKGGTNWITRTKPGNSGQLPAYIQNIRNAIMRDGKDESHATALAIAAVKRWAAGLGGVTAVVKAAAAKAVAQWEALKAKSKAIGAAKAAGEAVS